MVNTNSACDSCIHKDICKMKKEYANFIFMVAEIQHKTHKDGTLRFPDFEVTGKCSKYMKSFGVPMQRR